MGDELKLVKYITEQVVTYIETPREERQHTEYKEPWATKWFGMIPISLSLWRSNISREVPWEEEDPTRKEHVN
ncbi:hypothetical protein PMSD_02390 [Paenibacillus macquariensis subsp. defensor]|nr:hypothetical protein PMSD_02390 [Paenibacillus macquariensis subsp. defensor]